MEIGLQALRGHRGFIHRALHRCIASAILTLATAGLLFGAGRSAAAQRPATPAPEAEESELPHPFFTHMGLPEGVGVYNLRVLGLAARADGKTDGDFAFHLETGLTKSIGLHIRNDRFVDQTRSEAMFQFLVILSANGMSGFAPIVEFEIPTRSGGDRRVATLVGFTSTLANDRVAFNEALHYDPREDGVDASASLVTRLGTRVFPVFEVLGEGGKGRSPVMSILGGLKLRVRDGMLLGLAYQVPVTSSKDFSWQLASGPDLGWRRGQ